MLMPFLPCWSLISTSSHLLLLHPATSRSPIGPPATCAPVSRPAAIGKKGAKEAPDRESDACVLHQVGVGLLLFMREIHLFGFCSFGQ